MFFAFLLASFTNPNTGGSGTGTGTVIPTYQIENYGGVADGVTDNCTPFSTLMTTIASSVPGSLSNSAGTIIQLRQGIYFTSCPWRISQNVILQGVSTTGSFSNTVIEAANGVTAVQVDGNTTSTSGHYGNYSTIQNLAIWGKSALPVWQASHSYASGTVITVSVASKYNGYAFIAQNSGMSNSSEPSWGTAGGFNGALEGTTITDSGVTWKYAVAAGIRANTQIDVERVYIQNSGTDAILIVGSHLSSPATNVNGWQVRDVNISSVTGNGIYVQGADANAGTAAQVVIANCGQYDINDQSFLGNSYFGINSDSSGLGAYKTVGTQNGTMFYGCYAESEVGGNSKLVSNSSSIGFIGMTSQTGDAGWYLGPAGVIQGNLVPQGTTGTATNTAVGSSALGSATGTQNTAYGYSALASLTSAGNDTAVGYQALGTNTGGNNTAVGSLAAQTLSSGTNVTAIGFEAVNALASNGSSTGIGSQALLHDTGGTNTAVGSGAGQNVSGGTANAIFGGSAGTGITTGTNEIACGFSSGNGMTTGTNEIAIGTSALGTTHTGSYNIAIGDSALGSFSGSGTAANVGIGHNSGHNITTGNNDTCAGFASCAALTTASAVTSYGYASTASATTAGNLSAFGYQALNNATGLYNSAFGNNSGLNLTSGQENSFFGFDAGLGVTTGTGNSGFGIETIFTSNTASFNSAFGDSALLSVTGGNNTCMGYSCATNLSSGTGNSLFGFEAGINLTTGSNNIEIGNLGNSGDSGAIKIGVQGTQTSALIAGIYNQTSTNGIPVYINSSGILGTAFAATGLTAAANDSQSGCTALTAAINVFSTVGATTNSTCLPVPAAAGQKCSIVNYGANTLHVFPASGGKINAGTSNAEWLTGLSATSAGVLGSLECESTSTTDWACK